MLEIWQHAISPVNLPYTIPLGVCVAYGLLMIVGALDLDTIDGALDLHHDVDLDAHADAHVDGHVDHDAHVQGGGLLHSVLDFLHILDIPVMIVSTVLSFCCWLCSMSVNYLFNPEMSANLAWMFMVPILIVSCVVTHFVTIPIKKVFQKLQSDVDKKVRLVGEVATVLTGEVSNDFGQARIDVDGAPITLNVRSSGETRFHRGDKVLVVEENKTDNTFRVVEYKEPKIED